MTRFDLSALTTYADLSITEETIHILSPSEFYVQIPNPTKRVLRRIGRRDPRLDTCRIIIWNRTDCSDIASPSRLRNMDYQVF